MTRRKIILLFFGFLVMLLGTTYLVLQETGASKAFVERILSRFIRTDFDLKEAIVDLAAGTITLEDFQLTRPGDDELSPLLVVQLVEFGVNTNPLGEIGALETVKLRGLEIDLTEGFPNLYELLNLPVQTPGQDNAAVYPPVIITESIVRLQTSPGNPPIEFNSVALELVPESPGSTRMTLSGSMSTSAGFDLQVGGNVDPDKGEFRAVINAEDISLTPELAALVQPDLQPELEAMEVAGHIDRMSLWVEYPSPTPEKPDEQVLGGGVSAEISDLALRLPPFPYPIRGATATVSASTRASGSFKFELKSEGAGGNLDIVGALTNCLGEDLLIDVRAKGQDLLVGVDLRDAIEQQPVARRVWKAFEPRAGRVDVDVHLANNPDDLVPRLEMDLDLAGVSMTFRGFEADPGERELAFPLPFVDAVGRVRLRRDGMLNIEQVRAKVADEAGGGEMSIDGFLITEDSEGELRAFLDIAGRGVQFSKQMRDAVDELVEGGGKIFDEYGPQGTANVDVRIRPDHDAAPTFQVQIRPLRASASFHGFPYRISGIEGLVRIDPEGASFELTGGDGDAGVELRGRFILTGPTNGGNGDGMKSELWLEAESVEADDKLHKALAHLSPTLSELWDYLSPAGLADCELSLWKSDDAEVPSFDLRIDVRDGTAKLANFPIPLEGMNGSIFVHGTPEGRRTEIFPLQGRIENGGGLEPASVFVQGTVLRDNDSETLDLTSTVRGLELNQTLAQALDHNGAFRLSTWNIIKPSGKVNIVLRQLQPDGAEQPDQYLRVWLDNVRSDAEMLPQPATHITGEVRIVNGEAVFGTTSDPRFEGEDFGILTGRVGSAEITCREGHVRRDGEGTEVKLTVASEDFPVDDNLANLMKGPLKLAYLDRNVQGAMTVRDLTLAFNFPEHAEDFVTSISGQVRARGVSMRLGTQIESINGALFVDEAVIGPGEGFVNGHLHNVSFRILGHDCHGFQANYHADAEKLQMGLPSSDWGGDVTDLSMNLHGGIIQGRRGAENALQYEFRDGGVLTLDATFEGMSLSEFLRVSGFPGSEFRGTLDGYLQVTELIDADFVDMEANGRLRISDADLGAVPAFSSIYAYIARARRPRFDGAVVEFRVGNRRVAFDRVEVGSPLLDVSGDGTMTMDGYLDMQLQVPNLLGEDADWLVLPQLVQEITSRVVQFNVFGFLRNIRVEPKWPFQSPPGRERIWPIPAPPQKIVRPRY